MARGDPSTPLRAASLWDRVTLEEKAIFGGEPPDRERIRL